MVPEAYQEMTLARRWKNAVVLFVFPLILAGCNKGSSDNLIIQMPPSDLTVKAAPLSDGSGEVTFMATAVNAASYIFEYGDGIIEVVAGGTVTHRYTTPGRITYDAKVTAKSSSGLAVSKTIQVSVFVSEGMKLVFSDEFDAEGAPDSSKWTYDLGTGAGGWGNNELQYYTSRPENAVVKGGVLRITAVRDNYKGSAFTSARLLGKGRFSFRYGRVEVRAKFPSGYGTWPAAWMLGADIDTTGWPYCGEIDIVEHVGRDLNRIYGTLHYPGRSGGNADGNSLLLTGATTEFHTYSVDWSATSIRIFVDDKLYHTVANSSSLPFNHDFFILLNLAMGGNFGGPVDPALASATFEVDFVRVYR